MPGRLRWPPGHQIGRKVQFYTPNGPTSVLICKFLGQVHPRRGGLLGLRLCGCQVPRCVRQDHQCPRLDQDHDLSREHLLPLMFNYVLLNAHPIYHLHKMSLVLNVFVSSYVVIVVSAKLVILGPKYMHKNIQPTGLSLLSTEGGYVFTSKYECRQISFSVNECK